MKRRMLDYMQYLESEITSLQSELAEYPSGRLLCARDKKHMKWYLRDSSGLRYIYKNDRPFAEKMAYKRFLEAKLDGFESEKRAVQAYLNQSRNINEIQSDFYSSNSNYLDLLANSVQSSSDYAKEWVSLAYHSCPYKIEQKTCPADGGLMVRSKSESLIASKLFHAGIPFRYECELILPNAVYYPDFTILKPKTNTVVYHEHFGIMDNADYVQHVAEKIINYEMAGIFLGQNLTATFETKQYKLRSDEVDLLINKWNWY